MGRRDKDKVRKLTAEEELDYVTNMDGLGAEDLFQQYLVVKRRFRHFMKRPPCRYRKQGKRNGKVWHTKKHR